MKMNTMSKVIGAGILASAISFPAAATVTSTSGLSPLIAGVDGSFAGRAASASSFTDIISFSTLQKLDVSSFVGTIGKTAFSSLAISLWNGTGSHQIATASLSGSVGSGTSTFRFSTLDYTGLAQGAYQLHVNGLGKAGAAYAGTISAVAAVPEPETWGMLVIGAGLVGVQLRRKAAATA